MTSTFQVRVRILSRLWYLLKWGAIWNDLKQPATNKKRPTTSKKRPEMTYNDLKRLITNKKWPGNNLQQARNDLNRPTMSKTQPTKTWTDLQRAKKDAKQPTRSRFWDYFTIWGNWFSSLTRFQPNILLRPFEHCFKENHGENRVPKISILSWVFIMGYKIYGILKLQTTLTLVN